MVVASVQSAIATGAAAGGAVFSVGGSAGVFIAAAVKDVAGNSSSVSGSVLVDITAPALTINTVSADDVITRRSISRT